MSDLKELLTKELKTVGDCINLCNAAGIEMHVLDENLFETAGVIKGFLEQIEQLQAQVDAIKANTPHDVISSMGYKSMTHFCIDALLEEFEKSSAENFITMDFESDEGEKYEVVFSKLSGESRTDQLTRLKAQVKQLEQSNQLTMEQALIVSGYTGIMAVPNFSILHEEIEKRMDRPVFTHELANEDTFNAVKAKFKDEFLGLIPTPPTEESRS